MVFNVSLKQKLTNLFFALRRVTAERAVSHSQDGKRSNSLF